MEIRAVRFNIYYSGLLMLAAAMLAGCQSPDRKERKQTGVLRLHMEITQSLPDRSSQVPVYRAKPLMVNVDKQPFLTEFELESVRVVDDENGFSLELKFTKRGSWLLENATADNPGRRIAVFVQFGAEGENLRWLAAPRPAGRIADGTLKFTPDATREEALQIALALNNVVKREGNQPKSDE